MVPARGTKPRQRGHQQEALGGRRRVKALQIVRRRFRELAFDATYFFSGLKRLQIFDDRPALVFGEVSAVFVTAIAVAIRVRRIDDKAAALER